MATWLDLSADPAPVLTARLVGAVAVEAAFETLTNKSPVGWQAWTIGCRGDPWRPDAPSSSRGPTGEPSPRRRRPPGTAPPPRWLINSSHLGGCSPPAFVVAERAVGSLPNLYPNDNHAPSLYTRNMEDFLFGDATDQLAALTSDRVGARELLAAVLDGWTG